MNCAEVRQHSLGRMDGGAHDPVVDSHLSDCETCRRYVAQVHGVMAALGELRDESETIVSERPLSAAARDRRWSRYSRSLVVARIAAVIAVAAGGVLYLRAPYQETPESVERSVLAPITATPAASSTVVQLHGETAIGYLAVHQPSRQPNVDVFWLYPTLPKAARGGRT